VGQSPHKKKGKKPKDEQVAATEEVDEFTSRFEKEFSLASVQSGHDSSLPKAQVDQSWRVDCTLSSHMTGVHDAFLILEHTPLQLARDVQGVDHLVTGVGRVRFMLDIGELLEVSGVLFVPGLRGSILSVAALTAVGYSVVFQRDQIFTYPRGVDPVLLGHRIDDEYLVQGRPTTSTSRWLSTSSSDSERDDERDAHSKDEARRSESSQQMGGRDAHHDEEDQGRDSGVQMDERDALDSDEEIEPSGSYQMDEHVAHAGTSQRLSWYEMVERDLAQERAESARRQGELTYRVESSKGHRLTYRAVDPLDSGLQDWLQQQRFRGSLSLSAVTESAVVDQGASSEATLMEIDQGC
jgi:hypothetical protein